MIEVRVGFNAPGWPDINIERLKQAGVPVRNANDYFSVEVDHGTLSFYDDHLSNERVWRWEGMKLCKDCRWFVPVPETAGEPECSHDTAVSVDLVTGLKIQASAHGNRHLGLCGLQGQFWERREEPE